MSSAKDTDMEPRLPGIERRCPVCDTILHPRDKFCTSCGTKLLCPACQSPISSAVKFCTNCGTKLEWPKSPRQQEPSSLPSPTSDASFSHQPRPLTLEPSRFQQSPVADLLAKNPFPSQSLRETYLNLGIALIERQNYIRAAEAFQYALDETSSSSETTNILFFQAYVYEQAGKGEKSVRTYLEAILQAPEYIDAVLLHIHRLLTPDIALTLSTWITDEWKIERVPLNTLNRAHLALLLGHIHLYLANYDQTLEFFKEAAQLAPDLVPTMVDVILAPDILPTALAASDKDGNAHYTLAKLHHTLRSYQLALREVNQALDIGLIGESSYPQAPALQLKAQILEATEKWEEAAQCFYEAGRYFYWNSEYVMAREQFGHAAKLRPDHAPTYWYLADDLLMYSYAPEPPDTLETLTKECLEIWDRGFDLGLPGTEYAWVYVTRALINGQQVNLPYASQWALSWEAIIYLERAMLLGKEDADTWAYLGRYYRALNLASNPLNATERALNNNDTNLVALAERAAILAIVGRFKDAEEAIKRFQEQRQDEVWMDGVRAYVLFYKGQHREALDLLNGILKRNANDIWPRGFRAFCYRLLGEHLREAKDYRVILKKFKMPDVGLADIPHQSIYGDAAYCLGEIQTAIIILENSLKDPTANPHFRLGLCYFVQGQQKRGENHMHKGIMQITEDWQLDLFKPDFEDIKRLAANSTPTKQTQIQEILTRLQQAVEEQRVKLKERPSPEEELKGILKMYPRRGKAGKWGWIGAQASLARLYTEEKRWYEAAQVYQLLLKEGKLFPEARIGLEGVANELEQAGDTCLDEGNANQALERFSLALSLMPASLSHDYSWQGDLYSRLGFTYFLLSDQANTRMYFARALQCYRQHGTSDPGYALSKLCRLWLRDAAAYWNLDAVWRTMEEDAATDEDVRSDLASARNSLVACLDDLFKLSQQNVEGPKIIAFVRPIILEIGEGLIPADTSNEWSLFKTYIPEMNGRLMEDLGIKVAGIRVRGGKKGTLPQDAYTTKLDENLVVTDGHVELGRRYCPASPETLEAIRIPQQALIEAPHPLIGTPGCWIPPDYYARVTSHSLDLWAEELVFIIYHVEAVLRRNLENFMRMQDVERLLVEWKESERGASLIASVLPDAHTKFFFARILRALVQEQVPIKQWEDILEATQETGLTSGDCSKVIRAIRLRLKQWLPGNNPTAQRLELPVDWEETIAAGLRYDNDRVYFVAPPAEIARFLATIRDRVHSQGWNYVLVTRSPELRPFVRLLIESEFPFLAVLSEEELLSPDELQTDEAEIEEAGVTMTEAQVQGGTADAQPTDES
jgi:tetratricopeptide (TPR) repeat protein